jgi:hypothetical protein
LCVIPIRKAEDNVIFEMLKTGRDLLGNNWAKNDDMANCLEGKYPNLLEGLAMMGNRTRCSFAFSPNFAVTGTHKLYYRHSDQPVGKVENGVPSLFHDYNDLREMLQEDLR